MRMRINGLVCVALTLLAPVAGRELEACGDKFLLLSRGTRFERPSMRRMPAAIVAYARAGSGLPAALAALPVRDTLVRAGYTFTVVTTAAELEATLAARAVDLVMLDLVDAPAVSRQLTAAGAPSVLPVVFGRTTDEVNEVLKGFTCAVKSPRRNQSFLDAVDEALDIRRRVLAATGAAAPR
jgi:hypothetical protein